MSKTCNHPTCHNECRREKKPKKVYQLKRTPIKRAYKPNLGDKDKDAELDTFFEIAAKEIAKKPYCCNCGAFIPDNFYRFATAHVLAKRKSMFPSVATHPDNWITLCVSEGCHQKFDKSWDDASKMKCWQLAVDKFKLVFPFIDDKELYRLPFVLLKEIESLPDAFP